ncbi:aminotransferase class V-fold PLP-dependent enzyme [Pacificispira sp.]|uniref:aminotransferase class V-fold PLP-dependent enzyme n=1 Tax=Pacificispira sp. TaxID=2888761 RepID=UPI003BABD67F
MTEPKHLFIPGPTNIPDRVRRAMNLAMEDIRAPDFPELTKPLFRDLKTLFKSETGEIFLFPSSGTGAWEAALTNTLSPGDRVIVASFGQFSMLWAKMCRDLGFETEEWETQWGEAFPLERLEERLAQPDAAGIKAVLVCQNETATGVASDVAGVRRILDAAGHPALLMVDGISSIACIEFRMDDWGVDLAIAGSQKGLMLPTGLSVVCASRKALAASETAKCRRSYFDFAWHAGANKDGYFPYTPATQLLRGLRVSLDILAEEGIENVWARHNRLAEGVRRAVRAWGLDICAARPEIASDTVTAVVVPEGIDSADVVRTAYHKYNTSFGVGLSKVAGRVFRIGHLGALDEVKILSGIAAAEIALRDCGVGLQAGSGVGAAIDYYRETAPAALAAAAE